MSVERCWIDICFVPLNSAAPALFSFPEFVAGLALMVLAWTIGDIRYRFRVRVAPIPLRSITFVVVASVGALTLLTDLWRLEGWLVPKGNILTPTLWQALLAGVFLVTFLLWAWFAFLHPATFSKWNAKRYAHALYIFILKGSADELAVISDELTHSTKSLVHHASNIPRHERQLENKKNRKLSKTESYANDILLLIADKRFCRAIVASSPVTALAIFEEIDEAEKYSVQISIFAKNIVQEALANKDSFLYHEAEGYESGLMGYHKPLTQALFSNYELVESIDTMLDTSFLATSKWDADQWEAYCRIVLITFKSYITEGHHQHSFVLYRAFGQIAESTSDLYTLNGASSIEWTNDAWRRLRAAVDFVQEAIRALEGKDFPQHTKYRTRDDDAPYLTTIYDHLAHLIFEIIFNASAVTSPSDQCWAIQRNSVWAEFFNFGRLDGKVGQLVKFKLRRLLFNEIKQMEKFPNFKGARILGFCLNVLGLNLNINDYDKDSRPLHKAILTWTRKNFAWLDEYNPRISQSCLVDNMGYDSRNRKISKMYSVNAFRREPEYEYFEVENSQVPAELNQR